MAWRKLEDTFHSDRKIRKLARELAIPEPHAAGYVVTLWSWALLYAKDGDLEKFDIDDIEYGAKWDGAPGDFVRACVNVNLLDSDGARIAIHNWIERGGSYAEAQRKRTKSNDKKPRPGISRNFQENPGTSRKIQERPGKSALEENRIEERRIEDKKQCDVPDPDGPAPPPVDGPKIERDDINEIWQHYRAYHPNAAKRLKANRKEYRLIRDRLEDFGIDDLKRAIDGYHQSPFHTGSNENHKQYLSLDLIMRDIGHVQNGLEFLIAKPSDNGRPRPLDLKTSISHTGP